MSEERIMAATSLPSLKRTSIQKKVIRVVQYGLLTLISVAILVPIVILIFGSLKTRGEMYAQPYIPPVPPYWGNYVKILGSDTFWHLLMNSTVVSLLVTIIALFCSSLAAFAFSRLQFRGREVLFNFFTLGLMFPITVAILPVYLFVRQIGLTNTLQAVIIVQAAFQVSGNMMILRGFFASIPSELQDAARIDGCGYFDFFRLILLPLARPALAATASLTLVFSWNDLLVPLVLVDKETLWTLPLGTMQFQGQYGTDLALVAAFVSLSAVPALLFYMFAEQQIVAGLTAGAVKG
jgi:raffinose/stachyose/melibiose transport system permease protein